MLFVKRTRILITCSRRLENPAGLRLSPSLSFFFVSGIVVMQMRGGGTSQPLYRSERAGRPAAGRPGGPGRPAARRPAPMTCLQFFHLFFADMPLPPGCRVYFCKFANRKYIFIKNGNKKYKNKKTARTDPFGLALAQKMPCSCS